MFEPLMSRDQIYEEVRTAIADVIQISPDKVQPDSSLIRLRMA